MATTADFMNQNKDHGTTRKSGKKPIRLNGSVLSDHVSFNFHDVRRFDEWQMWVDGDNNAHLIPYPFYVNHPLGLCVENDEHPNTPPDEVEEPEIKDPEDVIAFLEHIQSNYNVEVISDNQLKRVRITSREDS